MNRLTDVTQQDYGGNTVGANHVTIGYNAFGQRTSLNRYESLGTTNLVATTNWGYDTANRLNLIEHKWNSTTFASYAYSYDGLSRISSINSLVDGVSNFTYDATSQLTVADHTSQTDENYGYDLNGNRNTAGFTTGQNNQTLGGDGFTYTYDHEGNRTSRTETATGKVQEYTWDFRNRLTQVRNRNTAGGPIVMQVDYTYDALNRMVKRAYDADGAGSGATTNQYWAYDEGINALLEFNGSATTNLTHRYLWSDQVDELLADSQLTNLTTAGNALWALSDHLGTIRDIADYTSGTDSTAITNHRKYNAYGKLVSETNSAVDLIFGFTGKQLDDATGLQHNLFRWYDTNLGQWLSADPISFAAGDENVRRYVGNTPSLGQDPSGLTDWSAWAIYHRFFSSNPPRPNFGDGRGTFHYSENSLTFRMGGIADLDELELEIYQGLRRFRHFNDGTNDVATVRLTEGGTVAYFDTLAITGFLMRLALNPEEVPVALAFDDERRVVTGTMLDGHMLEGQRIWTVTVVRGPFQDAEVTINTCAYERKVGVVNDIGAHMPVVGGTTAQLRVWDRYFVNIMKYYGGEPTSGSPFSPGPTHGDHDTNSTDLAELTGDPLHE